MPSQAQAIFAVSSCGRVLCWELALIRQAVPLGQAAGWGTVRRIVRYRCGRHLLDHTSSINNIPLLMGIICESSIISDAYRLSEAVVLMPISTDNRIINCLSTIDQAPACC